MFATTIIGKQAIVRQLEPQVHVESKYIILFIFDLFIFFYNIDDAHTDFLLIFIAHPTVILQLMKHTPWMIYIQNTTTNAISISGSNVQHGPDLPTYLSLLALSGVETTTE